MEDRRAVRGVEQNLTVLVLDANPRATTALRLSEEARRIRGVIERARYRDHFRLETRTAVRRKDVLRAMLDLRPAIVHFCGHAEPNGLILEGEHGAPLVADRVPTNKLTTV